MYRRKHLIRMHSLGLITQYHNTLQSRSPVYHTHQAPHHPHHLHFTLLRESSQHNQGPLTPWSFPPPLSRQAEDTETWKQVPLESGTASSLLLSGYWMDFTYTVDEFPICHLPHGSRCILKSALGIGIYIFSVTVTLYSNAIVLFSTSDYMDRTGLQGNGPNAGKLGQRAGFHANDEPTQLFAFQYSHTKLADTWHYLMGQMFTLLSIIIQNSK